MCGRYTLTVPLSNLVDVFEVPPPVFDYQPRYNIAPTQEVPVVAQDDRGRRMGLLRWGLIPSWARDPAMGSRLINARSETVAEKPAFRSAFQRRRCLVPADGFYEWKREGGAAEGKSAKTPYWIHMASRDPFAFAGLWERWDPREGPPVHTFTILTTEASKTLRHIHPRMPVILPPEGYGEWLDTAREAPDLQDLFRPLPGESLEAHPVSTLVNSPRNDDPTCIEPAPEP
jgi:putative SOS response-associated peptidase YedK